MTRSSMRALTERWGELLSELVDSTGVPGAVLAVSWRGERAVAKAGTASLRSGLPVTPGTVFQLGSISKLYTASLIAALAGRDGAVFERPVADVLPEAGWMGTDILVRHLLTHTSGLGGDHFADTGRGDGCLGRYVEGLAQLPRDIPGPPGRRVSYCNSGFAVLGRVVEVLTGTTFDAALRQVLLDPLGAEATSTLPEDTILQPVAVGHNRRPFEGPFVADEVWNFSRSAGPLGGVCASAEDLLRFAELHLAQGRSATGDRILEPDVAAGMQRRHAELPPLSRPSARGLGWAIYDWPTGSLVGHDGETTGQIAKLRLAPEEDLAMAVLTNGIPDGAVVARRMEEAVFAEWGLAAPVLPAVRDDPFDTAPFVGRYGNVEGTIDISPAPGGLALVTHQDAEGLEDYTRSTLLRPIGEDTFIEVGSLPPSGAVRFADPGRDGRYQSYFNGRLAWRLGDRGVQPGPPRTAGA